MRRECYVVMGFEKTHNEGGFRVFDAELGFDKGRVTDISGESATRRAYAQEIADTLNRTANPLRRFICRIGIHSKIETGDPEWHSYGGVERCTHCGKEFPWSNSVYG